MNHRRVAQIGATTTEQEAALYEAVVVPRYSALFARMLLREVPKGLRATVLDVGSETGYLAFDIVKRLHESGRVVAVDRDPAMVELGRRRALELDGKRIFFKVEGPDRLSFGDQVFDVVVGNLVLSRVEDPARAVGEMKRVLVPGGKLLLTRALADTFVEVLDMFREIALRWNLPEIGKRVDAVVARYPEPGAWAGAVRAIGLEDVTVREETFRLPFSNARRMFADPLIRFIGLPEWRWIGGLDSRGAEALEEAERSLDVYFASRPLSLTVRAGLVVARAPGTREHAPTS